ncbi:MAG: DNRLRE domain-containing protein [Actinomycetes bacterium]
MVGLLSLSLMASVQGGVVVFAAPAAAQSGQTSAPGVQALEQDVAADRAAAPVPLDEAPPVEPAEHPMASPSTTEPSPLERASAQARESGAPVVVEGSLTERSSTSALPDGSFSTEVAGQPVRFRDAGGAWRPLDLELQQSDGRWRPRAAPAGAPRVVAVTGGAPVVEVGEGARQVSWRLEGSATGRPAQVTRPERAAAAASARYGAVLAGGRDLLLQLHGDRVKESVVLPSRAAVGFPSYRNLFTVAAGVSARQAEAGVEFVDAAGVVISTFGGGHAFDSSLDAVGEPARTPVRTTLVGQQGRAVTVEIGVDHAWLADGGRVFPVTIDPDYVVNTGQNASLYWDAYIDAAFPTTAEGIYDSGNLKMGFRAVGGSVHPAETLLYYHLPAELSDYDNNVLAAKVSLYNEYSATCSTTSMPPVVIAANAGYWTPGQVTWNNAPPVWSAPTGSAVFAQGYSSSCPAAYRDVDVRPIVQEWSRSDGVVNDGFRVYAGGTSTVGYKRFKPGEGGTGTAPKLTVTWENCTTVTGGINGPKKLCGAIRDAWWRLGGETWGLPVSEENLIVGGSFIHFTNNGVQNRSIYYNATAGAHGIQGSIRTRWSQLGWEGGLGWPATDEMTTPDGVGRYNHFFKPGQTSTSPDGLHNSIYWRSDYGAHDVQGPIRAKWASYGWERGLGYPTTPQKTTPDTIGRYNHFTRPGVDSNSIYWSSATGAKAVRGAIRDTWAGNGWEGGWLGYPTSDELVVAGGWRSEFQGGNIVWDGRAGQAVLGVGTVVHPTQFQRVTQRRSQLKATARLLQRSGADSYAKVKFQTRPYTTDPTGNWADIPVGALERDGVPTTQTWLDVVDETVDGSPGKASNLYQWNATSHLDDGLVQVRACFQVTGGTVERCTGGQLITVDAAGLSGANSSAEMGPGSVSLLTGAYSITGRDAEVTAPHGGLAVSRTFVSNATGAAPAGAPSPLGPGWRLSLAADEAGADYQDLLDRDSTVLITRGDGTQMPFVRASSTTPNTYVAEGEAAVEGATLTFTPGTSTTAASYTLTNLDGDKVVFVGAPGVPGHGSATTPARFKVTKIEAVRGQSGSSSTMQAVTNVVYTEGGGNPQWLVAPQDSGAACPTPTGTPATVTAGCRALEFVYSGTGSGERLQTVYLLARGSAAVGTALVSAATPSAMQRIAIATYEYDANGRLSRVTDPRSGLSVQYGYRTDGRLASVTPPGDTASWSLEYDSAPLPRLSKATLDDGTGGLAPLTSAVRYDLPRDGSNAALPNLLASEVDRWGQRSAPTDLTAIFGPDTALPELSETALTAEQWRGGQLHALDVNGRTVNTANCGGTIDQDTGADQAPAWRISTTEYDSAGKGNVVRELTAGNRDRALAAGTDSSVTKAQAEQLDTQHVYSADGMQLLRSYRPARPVARSTGEVVHARSRTTTVYDTGSSTEADTGHLTPGKSLNLAVRSTVDAVPVNSAGGLPAGSSATDPDVAALDGVAQVTTYQYGNANAWRFGVPTATVSNPGGGQPDVVTRQSVDGQGRTVSRTL